MIRSRLHQRQAVKTVNVISRTYSGSTETNTAAYTGLACAYQQQVLNDTDDDWGKFAGVIDVFWFEPSGGSLPTITPHQFIVDGSIYYEVMDTVNQGGQDNRLKVRCKKWQDSTL